MEDDLLTIYGESAEDTVLNYIGKTYTEVMEEYETFPKPLVLASLLLVEHSYTQRSPVNPESHGIGAIYLESQSLKPYMKLTV